jgi:hypothetical protein
MAQRSWLAAALILLAGGAVSVTAQSVAKAVKTPQVPRAGDGHPDLSGIWTNVTITPLERPREMAGKEFFAESEVADYEKRTVQQRNRDQRNPDPVRDAANAYNDFWWDSGTKILKNRRTSIIVDPADGRIPALTAERQKQLAEKREAARLRCAQPGCQPENSGILGPADGPEDRPLMERCISFGTAGPPMLPSAYNNNYQIVQSPGFVAINVEMPHDVRRIPTDGSPHPPAAIREWLGDSRGHWEGDTLVVETTNFSPAISMRGSDENLRVTERFTRVDADTLLYRFTVDDPTAFTKPWSGEIPMVKAPGPLYEYACHEGNSGLAGILSAARADEKKAQASKSGR